MSQDQFQIQGICAREAGGEGEFYPTPPALCSAICIAVDRLWNEDHPASLPLDIIEPSAGTGNFVRAARDQWPDARITAVDIVDSRKDCDGTDQFLWGDWEKVVTCCRAEGSPGADLIIGNPPFTLAARHISIGVDALRDGGLLAFYLRISFFELTKERAPFWKAHQLRAFAPIGQRASHTGKGTDSVIGGLFVWRRGFTGQPWLLDTISWR